VRTPGYCTTDPQGLSSLSSLALVARRHAGSRLYPPSEEGKSPKLMLTRPSLTVILVLAHLLGPSEGHAQTGPVMHLEGEIRPRAVSREPVAGGWDHMTSMRTRIGVRGDMERELGFFIQIQDVRAWGEEVTVRDASADALDLHQAYLDVGNLPGVGGMIRVGRQEVAVGESRLVGAPDWGQAGQAFDGMRWIRPTREGSLELIMLQLKEDSSPAHEENAGLLTASFRRRLREGEEGQIYLVHDRDYDSVGVRRISVGGIWKKRTGPYAFRLQGIYQAGERETADVEAYLLAASGTLEVLSGQGSLTLWYDRLSGDSNPEDGVARAFSTLFGAGNRFYGRADYFRDVPAETGGLGLQDGALKLAYSPSPALSLNLDLHAFRTAADGDLSSPRLGEEADAWLQYRFREYLTIRTGYSLTRAGPGMKELEILEGTGYFGYFMTSLKF